MKDLTDRYAVREPSSINWHVVVVILVVIVFWGGVAWIVSRFM